MPINVGKLQQLIQENGPKGNALPAAGILAAALAPLQDTLKAERSEWNKSVAKSFGASIRAEAEARQINRDMRALTASSNEELQRLRKEMQQLRKEADAARKNIWWPITVSVLTTLLGVVAGWLLNALNAGQALSHLPHP